MHQNSNHIHVVGSDSSLQVGPTYGHKTLTGLLASDGVKVSEVRVGQSLRQVNPSYYHAHRNRAIQRLNPIPYYASHFGHKLHVDQNKKLVMYGVTHICAVDSFTGKVVGFISMPIRTIWRFTATFFGRRYALCSNW